MKLRRLHKRQPLIWTLIKWILKTFLYIAFILLVIAWFLIKLPFRTIKWMWQYDWGKFLIKSMSFVCVLGVIMGIITYYQKAAYKAQIQAETYRELLSEKDQQLQDLTLENQELQVEQRVLLAKSDKPTLTEQGFNTIVALLFPPDAAQRYKKIVETCENSTRNPIRTNVNTDGSVDLGVSQINNKWHTQQVKTIFNEDFWTAMSDSVKNIVMAAYIYHQDGNFHQWACDRIVAQN